MGPVATGNPLYATLRGFQGPGVPVGTLCAGGGGEGPVALVSNVTIGPTPWVRW